MYSKNPEYASLASRIVISNHHKRTKNNFSDIIEDLFEKNIIQEYLYTLVRDNKELKQKLDKYETEGMNVTVTMYEPVRYQTDSTPNILADGTRIKVGEASNYKFIAVSRNLLRRWGGFLDFGDWILLRGTEHKDGVYQVRDVMNRRFVNRIDILESEDVDQYMFPQAEIVKLSWAEGSTGQ